MKYTFVDTCFGSHHLQFGYDAGDTLWTSGGGQVAGWLNTTKFDATGDAAASQGWTAFVLVPTATAGATPTRSPIGRSIPAGICASLEAQAPTR
jgi:hypothetical protein